MKLTYALFAILAVSTVSANATDYCNPKLCEKLGKDLQHIACKNDGAWAPKCSQSAMVPLNETHKDLILNVHHKYRDTVAAGKTHLKPACRMATMVWDEELAQLAAFNVKQCAIEHDACHTTEKFLYAGQCLALQSSTDAIDSIKLVEKSIDLFYEEIKYTTIEHIASFPDGEIAHKIGHFTTIVGEKNTHVGCAAATYVEKQNGETFNNFLFACNYAGTNMISFPLYKPCEVPASNCTTGTNPTYKNLCSDKEHFEVNKWIR